MTDEINTKIARVEERQTALKDDVSRIHSELKEDIQAQSNRIDRQDGNIRFVVLAVLGAIITAVMNMIMRGIP